MLTIIKNKSNLLYKKLSNFGIETRKMLDKKFGGSVITTGIGSLFLTHFLSDSIYEINNATDAAKCNTKKLHDYHFHMIANAGIFFLPGKLGAFSDAHTKFDIKRRYDIKSDATETIVIIREAKVTAEFAHYLVPKEDNNAFLVTKISDWEELNLLKANANIYMNNTYIGETGIDPSLISDTMQLSLGRDHGLYCVRKKIKDESKETAFSKMIEHTEEFEIKIKNTNQHTLKVYIKDQIPVTNNEDIEITLLNPSKGELDEDTGELLWEVEIKSKKTITLKFGYTVRYDKEKKLAGQ